MRHLLTCLTGAIFGTGIAMSGMANPAKVLNFFDFAGTWDPSLGFVMGGALIVTFVGYRLLLARATPVYGTKFSLPANRKLDVRLLSGAAIFGIGWGIAGFCPGGALPALGTGDVHVILFVGALILGMLVTRFVLDRVDRGSQTAHPAE